jgi:hypothetical protein
MDKPCTATGYAYEHLPRGKRRDEVLVLIRVGLKFKQQQAGRKPDYFSHFLAALVPTLSRPAFAALLDALELQAARRDLYGTAVSPIEKVDRVFEMLTYHDPRRGRLQITLATLRNRFTSAKKKNQIPQFPLSPKQ